uniref:Uncharacterized protein n=1 Tax=Pipistrellus kuhlii TaxID=59472 RepID=A0A7J7SG95_PIPKU|nr:hypothetical protein mPipKuh1_009953 [Pipistrellus kuhlii]
MTGVSCKQCLSFYHRFKFSSFAGVNGRDHAPPCPGTRSAPPWCAGTAAKQPESRSRGFGCGALGLEAIWVVRGPVQSLATARGTGLSGPEGVSFLKLWCLDDLLSTWPAPVGVPQELSFEVQVSVAMKGLPIGLML